MLADAVGLERRCWAPAMLLGESLDRLPRAELQLHRLRAASESDHVGSMLSVPANQARAPVTGIDFATA
jgi:hypothetical protein